MPIESVLIGALRLPLRVLPDALHTAGGALVLNHLLRGQPLVARLPELEGRSVGFDVRDAGAVLRFRIQRGRLVPAGPEPSHVMIRGALRDFLDLATGAEDADTLFFQRRLCIEGDTEAGLHLKNLLDAFRYDWEAHLRAVLPAPLARTAVDLVWRARALRPRRT